MNSINQFKVLISFTLKYSHFNIFIKIYQKHVLTKNITGVFTRNQTFSLNGIWLVGSVGFNGPLRQYFSLLLFFRFNSPFRQYFGLYRAVSQREGERGEMIDERKNVHTLPTCTYHKGNRPLPYYYQNK